MEIRSRFDHFNINVSDLDRSLAFYGKALGLREVGRKQAADGSFTATAKPGSGLSLRGCATIRGLTSSVKTRATCVCASRAITRLCGLSTAKWAASASRTTIWGSTSSPTPTITGSKSCLSNSFAMQQSNAMQQEVAEAVRVLRAGGVILYPTDTVWGLGCDATNAEAVAKIYRLKQSDNKKSMLVLCASADMVVRYVDRAPGIAFEVMELATKPLTLILPGAVGVAPNLVPDEGTLGVRVPDHEFCRQLLRAFGRPVVSTSANISGHEAPAGLQEVARELVEGVDFVVNPRFEGKPTRKASSIIVFGEGGEVRIIRD